MLKSKKVVVFDLDGTLADTANLKLIDPMRRTPADILQFSPSFDTQNIFLFKPTLKQNINNLILCGIHVYVITRAPKAYASTLISLLSIDFCGLIPANTEFNSVQNKLSKIAELEGVEKSEMLYVGDQLEDKIAANEFGCDFQFPPWNNVRDGNLEILENLIQNCNLIVKGKFIGKEYGIDRKVAFTQSQKITTNLKNTVAKNFIVNVENYSLKTAEQNLFDKFINRPVPMSNILRPVINPHFVTRYNYESDLELRSQLFEILQLCGFEALEIKPPGINAESPMKDVEIYTIFEYRDSDWGGAFWRLIKDWKGTNSGPEVHLHLLEFVALVLAAAVGIEESDSPSVIIPVPSSPYSVDRPGQVSNRLCARISELTNVPILHFLRKGLDKSYNTDFVAYPFTGKHIFLIDDQITHGNSINGCLQVLFGLGINATAVSAITWSASRPKSIDSTI